MRLTIEYPNDYDGLIRALAESQGHTSRAAIIRQALAFFLNAKASKSKRKQSAKADRAEVRP